MNPGGVTNVRISLRDHDSGFLYLKKFREGH